jgi:YD repeat-containing protein
MLPYASGLVICELARIDSKEATMRTLCALVVPFLALLPSVASAAETITYSYDTRGRLKQVARSGTVNNGVTTSYTTDKADNRTNKTTSGSPNPPPP